MKPEAIVFDMDGTLVDAKLWHFEALNHALGIFGHGISMSDHLDRFDGLPTRVKLEMLSREEGLPSDLFAIISEVKHEFTLRIISRNCFPRIEQLLMFNWLKQKGVKVAVATNSVRRTAETMLESAGVLSYLDALVTNEDVREPKPSPEIYEFSAAALGVKTDTCLVVEDHPYGIRAAVAAGCQVIKVEEVEQVRTSLIESFFG